MEQKIHNKAILHRGWKIFSLFSFLVIIVVIFLFSVLGTIRSDRHIPSNHATIHDRSLRGSVVSKDGYTLSYSQKTYQAVVRGASIKPEKKALFVKFFSIYSDIPASQIAKKFIDKKGRAIQGNIILSKTLNAKSAVQLKELAQKLRKMDVFQWVENGNGIKVLYGLDVIENGESRSFPLDDVLTPILGYVGNKQEGRYIRPEGQKGLERHYDNYIGPRKNGYFQGKRDVVGTVIHDKNSMKIERADGLDLHLNIPLALQRRIEIMVDAMKTRVGADEIIVGVMKSDTGEVLSLATTERFKPSHITQNDIPALNPKFAEYTHEAGSVLKPLTLSIALEKNIVKPTTLINTENGRMKIGRFTITDDHKFPSLIAEDIIVHSSNIGISKIAWMLTGKEFREGLVKFGISKPSGIDLSRELDGILGSVSLLNRNLERSNSAFGYGMHVTFAQLLKAYSAFNNNGKAVTPRIVNYLEDRQGKRFTLKPKIPDIQPISEKTANVMHKILLKVVNEGTGVKARYPGLEIGGKTGTAHIFKNGHYVREYHSSFYGFVNDDKGNKYTIGVLVIKAKKYLAYFAAQSAVPTFRNTVEILVSQNYLVPDPNVKEEVKINEVLYGEEEQPMPPENIPLSENLIENEPNEAKEKPRVEPKLEPKVEQKVEPKAEPKLEPKVEQKSKPKVEPSAAKQLFENIGATKIKPSAQTIVSQKPKPQTPPPAPIVPQINPAPKPVTAPKVPPSRPANMIYNPNAAKPAPQARPYTPPPRPYVPPRSNNTPHKPNEDLF